MPEPEQVPEIQEKIDRERAERTSARSGADDESDTALDGWTIRRWLWVLVAASAAGFVVLGAGQLWFFRRPRSMALFSVLFPIGYVILNALLVSGVVGLVVSAMLRRERRQADRAEEMEVLVRLHADGVIDDTELAHELRDTRSIEDAERRERPILSTGLHRAVSPCVVLARGDPIGIEPTTSTMPWRYGALRSPAGRPRKPGLTWGNTLRKLSAFGAVSR